MLSLVTLHCSVSLISAQRQRVFSFLLAQGPKLTHASLFLCTLPNSSLGPASGSYPPSLRQALGACRPQLTPNTGRASETFCWATLSQGSLPALKRLHSVILAQLKSFLSICWHCPPEDTPCVWKLRPLVCPSFLGGLLCQGRNPVPSGFYLWTWRGVGNMPAS